MSDDEQAVLTERRGRVLLITLNRPDARNAVNAALALTGDPDDAWVKQGEIVGPVFVSEDAREGATAFAEKRTPVWKGR